MARWHPPVVSSTTSVAMWPVPCEMVSDMTSAGGKSKVFVIHGHGGDDVQDLASLLTEKFDVDAVVLEEVADRGRTLIQKFEEEAEDVGFAVALFTPDDFVPTEDGPRLHPRQNVLFELGWFCSSIGRECVFFLCKQGTTLPSDLSGILTTSYQDSVTENHVLMALEREMAAHDILAGGDGPPSGAE